MTRPFKLDDLIVKDPLPSRIRQWAGRTRCKITRRHDPQQKMYCVICRRCDTQLEPWDEIFKGKPVNRMSPYAKELLRDHGITVREEPPT